MFKDLEAVLPFENLRNAQERENFLLCTAENQIVGMTVAYARQNLSSLRDLICLSFDTVIAESNGLSPIDLLQAAMGDTVERILLVEDTWSDIKGIKLWGANLFEIEDGPKR